MENERNSLTLTGAEKEEEEMKEEEEDEDEVEDSSINHFGLTGFLM